MWRSSETVFQNTYCFPKIAELLSLKMILSIMFQTSLSVKKNQSKHHTKPISNCNKIEIPLYLAMSRKLTLTTRAARLKSSKRRCLVYLFYMTFNYQYSIVITCRHSMDINMYVCVLAVRRKSLILIEFINFNSRGN